MRPGPGAETRELWPLAVQSVPPHGRLGGMSQCKIRAASAYLSGLSRHNLSAFPDRRFPTPQIRFLLGATPLPGVNVTVINRRLQRFHGGYDRARPRPRADISSATAAMRGGESTFNIRLRKPILIAIPSAVTGRSGSSTPTLLCLFFK